MQFATVRRHTRKVKNGATTVRKHSRKIKPSNLVKQFKNRYAIKSGITITSGDYNDPQGTSMALTESRVKKNSRVPIDHKITTRDKKINSSGEDKETLIHHELSHILAREKSLKTLPEFKELISVVKETKTYQDQVKNDDTYGKDNEEIFARLYSQYMTGDTTSNDYLFSKKELSLLTPVLDKLLKKVTGTKKSIKK